MSKRASVDDCRLIRLPKHERENGNITVVENDIDLPFAVKRVYYLYDVPGGEERGTQATLPVVGGGRWIVRCNSRRRHLHPYGDFEPTLLRAAYRAGYLAGTQ